MNADISCGLYASGPIRTRVSEPISRLIDRTVRSGATAYWLRAWCPTTIAPDSSSPTHEGTIASSSAPTIRGAPPTMIATSELVVPRSMPITGS